MPHDADKLKYTEAIKAMNELTISKDDYEEPCCPFKMPDEITRVPMGRIIEKLDSYLNKNDYSSAERHLNYWLEEAEREKDLHGKLTILNEQIGLYRKVNKREECLKTISDTLELADSLGLENTVIMGTTLINAATGYKACSKTKESLELYRKARVIYESALRPDDDRLGGLYNNMALALVETSCFEEAEELFKKAISVMSKQEHGEGEIAITYCNLADLVSAKYGLEEGEKQIEEYLMTAEKLLDTQTLPHDGNHAFICEKCASVFGYYGFFMTERKLLERSREIYERA